MKTVSSCPSCGGEISHSKKGLVSPFLAQRIWARAPFHIQLMKCERCHLMFFNPRLEPEEEARHYSGYRDLEYQAMRQSFEPWYTPRFNANITNPEFLRLRKSKVAEILKPHLANRQAPTILDFGGAHGELVQGLIAGARPYVYEVSGVEPFDGVGICADLTACRSHDFDLIISSNVLEHVGDPRALVQEMRQIAGPGTMLWVEVPFESPIGPRLIMRRFVQEATLCLLRPKVALSQARPGMLHLMHEHVNFFTLKALESLLRSAGWDFIASGKYDVRGPLGYQEFIWALGKSSGSGVS
jgi:SAM-dependent methyltransferase